MNHTFLRWLRRVLAITLQSAHRCHPLWTSETKLLTMPARVVP